MKKISALFTVIFIGLFVMSCGSDETAKISPEKAKIAFSNVNQSIATDLDGLNSAPGFTAINSLSSLNSSANPFGRMKSIKRTEVRDQIHLGLYSFRSILLGSTANGRVKEDVPFDYSSNKGVYTYNFETQDFDRTGESTIIKILYPTDGSPTNNAEFQLTAYEEKYTPNGGDLYSPTIAKATISVDGTKETELDLSTDYGESDEVVKADIYLFINPYTIDLSFDDTKSTSTSFSSSLSKAGNVVIGVGLNVVFQNTAKDDPKTISGHLQLVNIRFNVSIDADKVATATDINDILDITIKVDGAIAGRVIFEQDINTGEYVPYIKFNDGTTELLESLFEDLSVQLESLLS